MTRFDVSQNAMNRSTIERHSIERSLMLLRGRLSVQLLVLVGRQEMIDDALCREGQGS
jgi:hypothetical protein